MPRHEWASNWCVGLRGSQNFGGRVLVSWSAYLSDEKYFAPYEELSVDMMMTKPFFDFDELQQAMAVLNKKAFSARRKRRNLCKLGGRLPSVLS